MASASSKMGALSVLPLLTPIIVGAAGYFAWRVDWLDAVREFVTGPGRTQRILILVSLLLNLKNLPLVWTGRVFGTIFYHSYLRPSPQLGPRALFAPMVTTSRSPLLETDYNLHKSNSTYFADLDVSRTHLVSYLCRPGIQALSDNARTELVLDPSSGKPVGGAFGIMLGSVHCSFRREIAPYAPFEMWSRVLAWDRKWMYIVTHFVPRGTAKPVEWLDPRFGSRRARKPGDKVPNGPEEWEKKIYASAVSKYVFKLGRFTTNPAVMLRASGLLPERPSGWVGGENGVGDETEPLVGAEDEEAPGMENAWDWRRVEVMRRKGMELASQFHALDGLQQVFDGGDNGALAIF